MKKEINFIVLAIVFTLGFTIGYVSTQYSYFKVSLELNVIETFLSFMTAIIGLFIAISIQNKTNRNQSLHNLLQAKMDSFCKNYYSFELVYASQKTLSLKIAIKSIKTINQDINGLKSLFKSFSLSNNCIDSLEKSIDDLDNLLTGDLRIVNNIIQLSSNTSKIHERSNEITQKIANAYLEIIKIL